MFITNLNFRQKLILIFEYLNTLKILKGLISATFSRENEH